MVEELVCHFNRFIAMTSLPAVAEVLNIKCRAAAKCKTLRDVLDCEAWVQKSHHVPTNHVLIDRPKRRARRCNCVRVEECFVVLNQMVLAHREVLPPCAGKRQDRCS